MELSAVREVLETVLIQVLGSFETLGSKLSHGTSKKFADVRLHLRKVPDYLKGLAPFLSGEYYEIQTIV
jgi:hypothetical protein